MDRRQDSVQIPQHIAIPEAQHQKSTRLDLCSPARIICLRFGVLATIELDY
jgi:hypothetical protein